jgi:hypothetical protein
MTLNTETRMEHPTYAGPIVVAASVLDYGAEPYTERDQTAAFQQALSRVSKQGGGIVWAPEGRYTFDGTLHIPPGVTLMGQWRSPQDEGGLQGGTVYRVRGGADAGASFIEVGASGGIAGATIYYPEQCAEAPIAYPPAIKLADRGRSFATARCLTLVNPYEAIHAGPEGNELHMIEHIYGTPLARGILVNKTTDIGRIQDVHFSPVYWLRYAACNERGVAPVAEQPLRRLLRDAVALELQRTDWEYVYRFACDDYGTGIRFERDPVAVDVTDGPNGQIYDIRISGAITGLQLRYLNTIGMCLTRGYVRCVDEPGAAAVRATASFASVAQLFDLSLSSPAGAAAAIDPGASGVVSFQSCVFERWSGGEGGAAVEASGGTVLLSGSRFEQEGVVASFREGLRAASLTGCSFRGESPPLRYAGETAALVQVDNTVRPYAAIREPEPDLGEQPVVSRVALYDAAAHPYDADRSAASDASVPLQRALDDAARDGGGIVYLPPGRYLLRRPLLVPQGVELRGSYAVPHHSNAPGTILFPVHGAGDADAEPAITLSAESGLRGLNIWYPEQRMDQVQPYPWTVRIAGEGAWLSETSIGNGYKGIDAWRNSGGHYIASLTGCLLKEGIRVSGSDRRGWLKNVHLNPHMYFRTIGTGLPNSTVDQADESVKFYILLPWLDRELCYAFRFGKTTEEVVFNSFSYRSSLGLDIAGEPGEAFDGTFYGLGCDGTVAGFRIRHTGERPLQFIHAGIDIVDREYATVVGVEGAGVEFMNSVFGGYNLNPQRGLVIDGPDVCAQQVHFRANGAGGEGGVQLAKGKLRTYASVFSHVGPIEGSGFSRQSGNVDVVTGEGAEAVDIAGNASRQPFRCIALGAARTSLSGNVRFD